MTAAGRELRSLLEAAARRVRRDVAVSLAAAVGAIAAATLVAAWLLARAEHWLAPGAWPLGLDLLALAAAVFVGLKAWRGWLAEAGEARMAAEAEASRGLPEGSVRGVLELGRDVPAGTSASLVDDAERRLAARLAGARPDELAGAARLRSRARRTRAVGALLGLGTTAVALGLLAPNRARAGWSPLVSPVAHLTAAALPAIRVEPGNARVPRGGDLNVRVQAPGRVRVTLFWRAEGDVRRERAIRLAAAEGATSLTGIDAPTRYWVEAPDGAVSDTFTVTPRQALLLANEAFDLSFPKYLARPPEHFDGDLPALDVPEGTVIHVRGRATRPLASIGVTAPDSTATGEFKVSGRAFSGQWTPGKSGGYNWVLTGRDGAPAEFPPAPMELTVVKDAPPQVSLTYPGVDTVLSTDLRQPVAAVAVDDHGLRQGTLVSWRVGGMGERDSAVSMPLALSGDPQRALLQGVLDVQGRKLLPGDTLFYYVRVVDNSPRRQVGQSETYRLRVPSMAEMRRAAIKDTKQTLAQATQAAQAADALAKQTQTLERRGAGRARMGQGQAGAARGQRKAGSNKLGYGNAEQAKQVLQQQQAMEKQVAALQRRVEAMRKAAEAAGLTSPEMQQRLQQLSELYRQLLTPELKQRMAALRQALQNLDPAKVQRAIEALAKDQQAFRKRLNESLELLRRAVTEQQMSALAQDARDLSAQQRSLADALKQSPTQTRARQQKMLATKADSLHTAMDSLTRRLGAQGEKAASARAAKAAQAAQAAQRTMAQAASAAARRDAAGAAARGQKAAQQLSQVASSLETARQRMARQWRQEAQNAVDQATADALALAERQNQLVQRMKQASGSPSTPAASAPAQAGSAQDTAQGSAQDTAQDTAQSGETPAGTDLETLRAEQSAVEQGVEALGRNLSEEGRRSALISGDVGAALASTMLSMERSLRAMEGQDEAPRLPVSEAGRSLDALNRLALALLSNQRKIQKSSSGTGLQQALQQLAEMAKRQGSLNAQTGALAPMNLTPQSLRQNLQQLAAGQRRISKGLDQLNHKVKDKSKLLGNIGQLKKESDAIAQALERGRLTPQVRQHQAELFHHLLDSGRTLERNELSRERVGKSPGDIGAKTGTALDTARIGDGIRYPVPTAAQLRALPPAYRRLILEYFERLNRAGGSGGGRP